MTRYSTTMREALAKVRGENLQENIQEAPEDNMPASPDEGSMAVQQLEFMMHAIQKMKMHIQSGGEFPEWMQNKLSGTHEKLKGLYANIEHGDMNEELDLDEMKMDDPKLVKAFDKMKKGDTIKLKTSSTISKGTDFVDYVVKSKNVVNKGRVEKITLATKGNEKAVKKFLYKRDGKVTFAIGDMGASIDDIKEGTWALPDSPKAKAELKKLMSKPIKLGKEGDEASDKLYALIGDDELFDDLYVAGKKNPNGDARDVVKKHMKRLGIKEEVELEEGKSSTGYELYHKDFSSAMAHAYDFAKKKFGIEVDPKEIDDKVASGPRKPSKGNTNSYRLKGKDGKKAIQVQVYGMDNGKYELNMYKEETMKEAALSIAEKLKVSDGLGAWIDDFKKSDAPQFAGKSDEDKQKMAIAAFVDAGGKLDEMAYKPGSPKVKDIRPQEKAAKALDALIKSGGLDKSDFQKARAMYVQASDMQSRRKLKNFISNLDTEPLEAILDIIGRNDPDTFQKMYPNSKPGEYLSTIAYKHRNAKNEETELDEKTTKTYGVEFQINAPDEKPIRTGNQPHVKLVNKLVKKYKLFDNHADDLSKFNVKDDVGGRDVQRFFNDLSKAGYDVVKKKVTDNYTSRTLGKEGFELDEAPKMKYALVGTDMKIYSMGSDERDLRLDRKSLEKRFKDVAPLKMARLKTAQSIGDKVDKSQLKEE